MTLTDKNNLYLGLKCLLSEYAAKLEFNLSVGKCVDPVLENFTAASSMLEVVCRHQPCCDTTYTYEIDIFKGEPTDGLLQLDLIVDKEILASYTGTGDQDVILAYFNDEINSNTNSTGFGSFFDGNSLTLYTCSEDFPLVPPVLVETDLGIGSEVISSEITPLASILVEDPFNCLTTEEICIIASKIKEITDGGC